MNGYELPIAMEVRRGRYLQSFEQAHPLAPGQALLWNVPLRDRDHVFLKGDRMMVQIQSTWFPVIDRNPQQFVANIYRAKASDFVNATQRVYCTSSQPSHPCCPSCREAEQRCNHTERVGFGQQPPHRIFSLSQTRALLASARSGR